jgi:hypothetical protein
VYASQWHLNEGGLHAVSIRVGSMHSIYQAGTIQGSQVIATQHIVVGQICRDSHLVV